MNFIGRDESAVAGFVIQADQQLLGKLCLGGVAMQRKLIATVVNLNAQALFNLAQVLIKLTAQRR